MSEITSYVVSICLIWESDSVSEAEFGIILEIVGEANRLEEM